MSFSELCSSPYSSVNAKRFGGEEGPYYCSSSSETEPSMYLSWMFLMFTFQVRFYLLSNFLVCEFPYFHQEKVSKYNRGMVDMLSSGLN